MTHLPSIEIQVGKTMTSHRLTLDLWLAKDNRFFVIITTAISCKLYILRILKDYKIKEDVQKNLMENIKTTDKQVKEAYS